MIGDSPVTTDQLVDEYATWLRGWARDTTVEARVAVARAFLTDCGGLDGVAGHAISRFLGKPNRDGTRKSDWTRATYHGHLKSLCEFLTVAGHLETDPMTDARTPKRGADLPRPLTDRDVEMVLAAAQGEVRDWIVVALATGLRVSEIARLRGVDVSTDGIYVRGKGGGAATLPSHPDVMEIAHRKSSGYWWPGPDEGHIKASKVSKKVGALFETLGLEGGCHRCRHTYGTRLLRAGVHIRKVQQLMRHASLKTTANYTAVDEDELRDAILLLPSSNPAPPLDAA